MAFDEKALLEARQLIDADHTLIYDVAASVGQKVGNIRHMRSFELLVADWVSKNGKQKEAPKG